MKIDDVKEKTYNIKFNYNHAFICGTDKVMKDVAIEALKEIEAKDKTVIVTDAYLFNSFDEDYINDLKEILLSLEAKKVSFVAKTVKNQQNFDNIKTHLNSINCDLEFQQIEEDIHDRFWLCTESNKSVIFGTSLNGLCKRICRIDTLKTDEIIKLKNTLANKGVTL